MIHIPDHLISFYNISGRGDASVTTTENTTKYCEKIEACEMGPLSYIAGYVVRKLTSARKKKTESENTELQGACSQSKKITASYKLETEAVLSTHQMTS
jgi:hypothetical protein